LLDPGVPTLLRGVALEAGLVLNEGDVRVSERPLSLGSSGPGVVHLAFHRGMPCALKTLKSDEHRDRELWALYRLSRHPGVVQALGVMWPEGLRRPTGLVFACVEGFPLQEYGRERGVGLLLVEILDMGLQVAMALDYCHTRGIVHGDLKW
jgi:serine/threonine protein kinase